MCSMRGTAGVALAACLVGAITAPSGGASAATIQNGSFENGIALSSPFVTIDAGDSTSINGWTVGKGGVDYIGSYWEPSEGNRSIDLSGNAPGTISQTITGLIAGQKYVIAFDLAGNPDSNKSAPRTGTIEVAAGGQSFSFDVSSSTRSDMGWVTEYFYFTALTTSELLTFTSTTSNAFGPALDNVRITETPLPAALPLFATGLGLVGAAGWRRKRKQQAA